MYIEASGGKTGDDARMSKTFNKLDKKGKKVL